MAALSTLQNHFCISEDSKNYLIELQYRNFYKRSPNVEIPVPIRSMEYGSKLYEYREERRSSVPRIGHNISKLFRVQPKNIKDENLCDISVVRAVNFTDICFVDHGLEIERFYSCETPSNEKLRLMDIEDKVKEVTSISIILIQSMCLGKPRLQLGRV